MDPKSWWKHCYFMAIALILTAGGCGPTLLTASRFSPATVDLPMISRKSPLPMVIVITPASVADAIQVRDDGGTRAVLEKLRPWLGHELKEAFSQLYQDVSVVERDQDLPSRRHLQMHVLVKRIVLDHAKGGFGNIIASQATVTWSIGLRLSDEPEYFYSMNESVGGELTDFKPAVNSAFTAAIQRFASTYVNKSLGERAERVARPASQDASL